MLIVNQLIGFGASVVPASYKFLGSGVNTGTASSYDVSISFANTETPSLVVFGLSMSGAGSGRDIASVIIDPAGANISCSRVVDSISGGTFDKNTIWQGVYTGTGTVTVRTATSGGTLNGFGISAIALHNLLSTTATDSVGSSVNGVTSGTLNLDVKSGGVIFLSLGKSGSSNIVLSNVTEGSGEAQFQTSGTKRATIGAAQFPADVTAQSVGGSWTTSGNLWATAASWR